MAKGKGQKAKEEEVLETGAEAPVQAEACPTFTIRADMHNAVRALVVAFAELDYIGRREAEAVIREFEMYQGK
jgi:hypothetical protein